MSFNIVLSSKDTISIAILEKKNIEKMTSANKVKTMVSGDMFIHIPLHEAGLIIQVGVLVTPKFSSSYFSLRIWFLVLTKKQLPDYKQMSVCHTGVVLAEHFNTPFLMIV